ncbi:MAG: CpXC domain-containing protein [Lentisphaeria bacterium]
MVEEKKIERVKCPNCGEQVAVSLQRVLTPDSRYIDDLFSGTLNCAVCSNCQARFRVACELIYKDIEHGVMIVENERPPAKYLQKAILMVDSMATEAARHEEMPRPDVRLVFSRGEFLEKLFLFRDDLDDRLIEYAKYQLFQDSPVEDELSHQKHRLLYDPDHSTEENIQFAILLKTDNKMVSGIQVLRKEFEAMAQEFDMNESLQDELDRIFPSCYVTVDRMFEEENNG